MGEELESFVFHRRMYMVIGPSHAEVISFNDEEVRLPPCTVVDSIMDAATI